MSTFSHFRNVELFNMPANVILDLGYMNGAAIEV